MAFSFEPLPEQDAVHHTDRMRWTEESFLDLPEKHTGAPSRFLGIFQQHDRLRIFSWLIFIVVAIFFMRVAYLQVIQGRSYAAIADKNRIRVIFERATRGLIVDRENRPIVTNISEFLLTLTPNELPRKNEERQRIFRRIADLLHESPLAITEEISALPKDPFIRRQALPFRERIDYANALQILVEESLLPGFRVETRERRSYPETYISDGVTVPLPESIAHVTGYLGKIDTDELPARQKQGYLASDLVGKTGIERSYEAMLHGKHGRRFIEIDALGQEKKTVRREEAETGGLLKLSLDLDLQRWLEDALRKRIDALPKRERRGAVGIAIDPRNGFIRAMVSLPSYPSGVFTGGRAKEEVTKLFSDPTQPLFTRAISGEYPSGSTIKPLIALAALEEGVITPQTSIVSTGGISVGPWFFPDWKAGGHGVADVRRAIAESINTFFYTIGGGYGNSGGLGIGRMNQWMKKFKLGEALGIDLPNEARGFVPTPEWKKEKRNEIWYIGDTYHVSIGQGDVLATPLQIASMTSFFANGGTLWQPTLLSSKTPVALATSFATPSNIQVVREGMRRTVTAGSAQSLSNLPVAVAGKTGTAEWSSKRPPHAWFTGFAPYKDPELVLTVMIEEGGDGSSTAVPVAYEVLREYFAKISKSPN